MDEIEKKLQELAGKALDSQDGAFSWWERLVALVVVGAGIWWTKYQLAQRQRELAEAKAKLEQLEVDAKWQKTKADAGLLDEESKAAAARAQKELVDMKAAHAANTAKYEEQRKAVDAISNWQDLDKYAGRTP